MPAPDEGVDLSAESCEARVLAIPDDKFAHYVYQMTREEMVRRFCHKDPLPNDVMIEMAQAEDDQSYYKPMTDTFLPAVVWVNDAIALVLELFKIKCADFVEARKKTLAGLKNCTRMEVVGESTMRLYDGQTQIGEGKKSPENIRIYRAYYNVYHLDDAKVAERISRCKNKNQLIHYFEETRTNAYFAERGTVLRESLLTILDWVKKHTSPECTDQPWSAPSPRSA